MDRQISCSLCGQKININDLEKHLKEYHLIDYSTYCELNPSKELCWKCGSPKILLTPFSENYHLPCYNCLRDWGKKKQLKELNNDTILLLESFLDKIENSEYIQYFLSDPELPKKVFPPSLDEFLSVVSQFKTKINKTSYIELSKKFLYSPWEISMRNINSIQLEVFHEVLGKKLILDGETYSIKLPEQCEYDPKHHSKYSILNLSSHKKTRKIKFGNNTCFKFTGNSIFKLINSKGEEINVSKSISLGDQKILKEYILRNKTTFSFIKNIYLEICKFCDILHDEVFIKNTIPLGQDMKINVFNFNWFEDSPYWSNINGTVLNLKII